MVVKTAVSARRQSHISLAVADRRHHTDARQLENPTRAIQRHHSDTLPSQGEEHLRPAGRLAEEGRPKANECGRTWLSRSRVGLDKQQRPQEGHRGPESRDEEIAGRGLVND